MSNQKRYILLENEIPTAWYNIVADMKNKPMLPLNPKTRQPLTVDEMSQIFTREASKQELNQTDSWIEIPDDVRNQYKNYRPTPLVRASELEKALDTPAHIYFKNESVSPVGSHKLNSAIPQAFYAKMEGIKNLTTETGAGQWGTALCYAGKTFGIDVTVFMVKVSFEQKPYRRSIMQTFGGHVYASPSDVTSAGRNILSKEPGYTGSLGTAISEAVEMALGTQNCRYALGSALSHVSLHQTVLGLEAEKQMDMAGEYPDIVIGCFGGGSNFSGIAFPFMRHNILDGKKTRFIAAEPASCPKLTRGEFHLDFADEAGYTPLMAMYTLGHNFKPAAIHAGGLRYHGAGTTVSQLLKDGLMEAVDIRQTDTFKAAQLFAQTEGIIPAPESSHAICAAINEALKCKEEGTPKTILFCLSGHGLIDMTAYDQYLSGSLHDYEISNAELKANFDELNSIIKE